MRRLFSFFVFLVLCSPLAAQNLTLADFDTIISKQDQKLGLSGHAYRFIQGKIAVAGFYGSEDTSGIFHMKGERFENKNGKEGLWVEVRQANATQNTIVCTIGYTAPEPVIRKMEQDLRKQGYIYKRRRNYYVKRKNRQVYTLVKINKQSVYVSELDQQPEVIFTAYKRLKK